MYHYFRFSSWNHANKTKPHFELGFHHRIDRRRQRHSFRSHTIHDTIYHLSRSRCSAHAHPIHSNLKKILNPDAGTPTNSPNTFKYSQSYSKANQNPNQQVLRGYQ